MSRNLAFFAVLGLTLRVASASPDNQHTPSINGRWQIVVFMADGVPLPSYALEDAELQITDGEMTFLFSKRTPTVLDKRQLRFEFVDNGLDVTVPDAPGAAPMKGAWSMDEQTFQFCYATDDTLGRPRLSAGKGLVFLMLKRRARRPGRSSQESLLQAIQQLEDVARWLSSTEAGNKAREALESLRATNPKVDVSGQALPKAYYYTDDVQYFPPGPQFKLRAEAAALKSQRPQGPESSVEKTD